jgi:hypothetical protein
VTLLYISPYAVAASNKFPVLSPVPCGIIGFSGVGVPDWTVLPLIVYAVIAVPFELMVAGKVKSSDFVVNILPVGCHVCEVALYFFAYIYN